jgi:hypothetical protein
MSSHVAVVAAKLLPSQASFAEKEKKIKNEAKTKA